MTFHGLGIQSIAAPAAGNQLSVIATGNACNSLKQSLAPASVAEFMASINPFRAMIVDMPIAARMVGESKLLESARTSART